MYVYVLFANYIFVSVTMGTVLDSPTITELDKIYYIRNTPFG